MFEELLKQLGLTVTSLASLLRRLNTSPLTGSVDLTVVVPTTASSMTVPHGLGRAANGASVVGQSDATRYVTVDLVTADETVTVRLSAAPAAAFTVKLRVY